MKKYPSTYRAARLTDVIGRLEGIAFGRWLEFSAIGYEDQLRINGGNGSGAFEGFERVPGLRAFADELNAATRPIRDAYARKLREELAKECLKIAEDALSPEVADDE